MSALHHVSMPLEDAEAWTVMAGALVDGDNVVLLDRAARDLQVGGSASAVVEPWPLLAQRPRVRWLLPNIERVGVATLPDTIELIDERHWLDLIVACPLLLEWN
jgi:hypothetical protein